MIETDIPGNVSPTATLLVVAFVVMTLTIALAWATYWWRTQRQRAAQALASVTSGAPPARGAVVLHGTVETEVPERPAITVTLWESGEEQEGKHGWTHTWTEERRETKAEPFYLALTASPGTLVRVEPDDEVFLVDALDSLQAGNPRIRRAELTNGEQAYVAGSIGKGFHARTDAQRARAADHSADNASSGSPYRGGPSEGLVLRAGRDRMLVSTEPLDQRYVRQAKAHRLFAAIFAFALVLVATFDFGPAIVTEIFGAPVDAEITSARHWTTRGKGGPHHHYAVVAHYTDARGQNVVLDTEVRQEVHDAYNAKRLTRLPFVVAFDSPTFSSLGTRVTTDATRSFVTVLVTLALFLFYRSALNGAREWYDQRRVVTRSPGRLPR
jgi:hypothetical protein